MALLILLTAVPTRLFQLQIRIELKLLSAEWDGGADWVM